MKRKLCIIFWVMMFMCCHSQDYYFWENTEYLHPCWISSDRILVIEYYKHVKIYEDAWGEVCGSEVLSYRYSMCEVNLSGDIVTRKIIDEGDNTPFALSVNNAAVCGDFLFISMRLSPDDICYEIFRIDRNSSELINLGNGQYPDPSCDGRKIVYNAVTVENTTWENHGLWMKNVDGSGSAICLADSVDYGTWSSNNLIAYCWYDTLFVVDTKGAIQYKWYAGSEAYRPDWSLSPDTVLISTRSTPRLIALNDGSLYDIPLNLGSHIRWSPDGNKFIYKEYPYWCLINRDGSNRIVLDWNE